MGNKTIVLLPVCASRKTFGSRRFLAGRDYQEFALKSKTVPATALTNGAPGAQLVILPHFYITGSTFISAFYTFITRKSTFIIRQIDFYDPDW